MGILPNCSDPSLKALKSIGYNVVQLPRVDLHPTQLLVSSSNKLKRLGEMSTVFAARPGSPALPTVSADRAGPSISITKTAAMQAGVGLNILGGLISALGGSTLGLSLAYEKAALIQMEYRGTKENAAELAAIDTFLHGAGVNPFAQATAQMLEADMVYVVTSTLKANKISVSATDSGKRALSIDVPVLSQAIGGNLKVSKNDSAATSITYEGEIPLVFGFQAVRLIFDDGVYRTMKLVDGGGVVAEAVGGKGSDAPVKADPELLLRG